MIKGIEHIGIAVKNIKAAALIYEKLLNTKMYKTEEVLSEQVRTGFLKTGGNKIELLESINGSGVIEKFITLEGEGLHHIAFEVDDIKSEMERLRKEGFTILNEEPKKGADNKWVCFIHPRDTTGVLIELCQEII